MNYVDLFIGGTLAFSIFRGYRKGVISSLGKILSYGAGVAVAIYFYRSFSSWLDGEIDIIQRVAKFIYNLLPLPSPVMTTAVYSLDFQELTEVVVSLPLPKFYQEQMLAYIDNYQIMLAGSLISIGETIAMIIANTIVDVAAFAMLLLATILVLRSVIGLVTMPLKGSFLAGPNQAAGAVLGLGTGVIKCMLLLGLLVPLVVVGQMAEIEVFSPVGAHINTSLLLPFFIKFFAFIQASAGGLVPFANGLISM